MENDDENEDLIDIDDGDINDLLEKTVKYEDVFYDRRNQLRSAMESIVEGSKTASDDSVVRMLNIALSGVGDTDSELDEAAMGFLHLIISQRSDAADLLYEHDASDDFVKFTLDLLIEFGEKFQQVNNREIQGRNWWSSFETERVIKESGVAHRHRFIIDFDRTVEIDSSPRSDLYIISRLLTEYIGSYNDPHSDESEILNLEEIDHIRALVFAIENGLEDEGIELTPRENLIENEEDSNLEDTESEGS